MCSELTEISVSVPQTCNVLMFLDMRASVCLDAF